MSRVLALDYGSARCGVAVSDPTGTLATPLDAVTRANTRRGLDRLATVVRETGAERVVVGLPLSLSGRDSAQTEEARAFAARLAQRLGEGIPVELYDERFTTRIAQRSGGSRASEDSRAAAVLLEDWLAAHGGHAAE
ncbi:MAG: Holliday junction resolvase RuvX [Solirubrobacteraceae bacterium]|nr:Holliday junction resolvase RuvX [Solirubrobacteraceae bacterium]